jgi:hypothetical protein
MTTEVQEYRCPTCGQLLGQQEYLHAIEKLQEKITETSQQQKSHDSERICELECALTEATQQMSEFKENVEATVRARVNEEIVWRDMNHNKQLEENDRKHRQELTDQQNKHNHEVESVKSKATTFAKEKEEGYRQREEENKLRISRLDEDNRKLQLQVDEQRKKLDAISSETKGTAGENGLFEELKQTFVVDKISCKKNGVQMADIVQYIVTEKGETVPTPIVYDKKTGRKVYAIDLEKAKNYKNIHETDYCIIVTHDIADKSRDMEVREGILLVRPRAVVDTAKLIRSFIVEFWKHEKENRGKDSKKERLYEFFTSPEYNRDIQTQVDVKKSLDELQEEERTKHNKWWNKRTELIRKWSDLDSRLEEKVKGITHKEEEDKDDRAEGADVVEEDNEDGKASSS